MADSKPRSEQANASFSIRIKIVTWNPKRANKCKGHFAELQKIFSKFLFNRISSKALVCEQEVTKTAVLNTSKEENLEASFHEGMTVLSPKSESVYSTEEIENERYDLSDFQCSGQLVTHNLTDVQFILISFHGGHNSLSDSKKQEQLEKFIVEMRKVANDYKLPVIVGGDFNIEVIKWKTEIEEKFAGKVVVAPLYAGAPNQRHGHNVIDTFIAVYPDNNVVECKFDTPIPIYILPATGYIGDIDDETKFLNYPNNVRPCCKVLNYNDEELQQIKETILKKQKANFEESYKDNNTDAILPLWPKCEILDELNHDPVMVTVELIAPIKKQVSL